MKQAERTAGLSGRIRGGMGMGDAAENAATRLWRDRAHLREQERNEVQARARLAEAKVAALTAENDRLASRNTDLREQNDRLAIEVARLGAQNDRLAAEIARLRSFGPAARTQAETEHQMEALKSELATLLDQPSGSGLCWPAHEPARVA
jgi:chromosome segregation ATPase